MFQAKTAAVLGQIGRRADLKSFQKRDWDAIIIGAGHNGLACAAYLARAGKSVLVLEALDRVGGACTLHETWPGYKISPGAYLCGLLHPLVIQELGLADRGFSWTPAEEGLFVPFPDGSSLQLWEDTERCLAEIRKFAPGDVDGFRAMSALMDRARELLRPEGERDLWLHPAPSRAELEERLAGDPDVKALVFEWSMAEYVERYLRDERLQSALLGQGVIGTNASPFDPGTASVNFHHSSGRMMGRPGVWGYVQGGMGTVSFHLCDIALEAGAIVSVNSPAARVIPGEGVELESGEKFRARAVVSNADPGRLLGLLGSAADPTWSERAASVPRTGCTMKVSVALREAPNFLARPGLSEAHHRGQINTPLTKEEWRKGFAAAKQGKLPERLWTEIYIQTMHDASVAPEGRHAMSMFCQYVPYEFERGDWESRREEAAGLALSSLGRFCSNIPEAIEFYEALGPPDVERVLGLSGGHIFQGEILPEYMWDRRLSIRTPMEGVYLCGAAVHPGGSVMGVNGRNAAQEVLKDLG